MVSPGRISTIEVINLVDSEDEKVEVVQVIRPTSATIEIESSDDDGDTDNNLLPRNPVSSPKGQSASTARDVTPTEDIKATGKAKARTRRGRTSAAKEATRELRHDERIHRKLASNAPARRRQNRQGKHQPTAAKPAAQLRGPHVYGCL